MSYELSRSLIRVGFFLSSSLRFPHVQDSPEAIYFNEVVGDCFAKSSQ